MILIKYSHQMYDLTQILGNCKIEIIKMKFKFCHSLFEKKTNNMRIRT